MTTTQMMINGLTTYDNVRVVDSVIDEAEVGIFFNSARLVDLVLRDARLFSVLSTRISGLLGRPLEFEPAKRTARGRKIADEIEAEWSDMFQHSTLVEMLTWGIMQGVAVAQVIEDTDPWTLEVWHPWALTWDPWKREYYLMSRETARINLTRGKSGMFEGDDGTKWILYTPYGYDNAGRRGILRAVHRLYMERQWSHRDRARYSEIYGEPIRFGIAPINSTQEERDEYRRRLLPLGAESVVVGAQGEPGNMWDLKLVEASGRSTSLFQEEIAQLDKEIATLVLGQSQSTDGQGGLGNQEKAGESVRVDIMRGDADTLSAAIHAQFLVPYCQFAYGSGELAPYPCWDVEPAEDMAAKALEFKNMVDGLVAAKAAGIPVDVRAVLEDFGVPMITEDQQAALDAMKQAAALIQPKATAPKNGAAATPSTPMMMQPQGG